MSEELLEACRQLEKTGTSPCVVPEDILNCECSRLKLMDLQSD